MLGLLKDQRPSVTYLWSQAPTEDDQQQALKVYFDAYSPQFSPVRNLYLAHRHPPCLSGA
jgi:hypothetical protein